MKTETVKYKRLDKTVSNFNGVGMPNLTAELKKRTDDVCMYMRSDGAIEVFKVQTRDETEIFGKIYPPMELYPSNEDFGKTAWCYKDIEYAERKFNSLTK